MGLTSAQAKGRIKNIASKNGADPRVLMRIYMMERNYYCGVNRVYENMLNTTCKGEYELASNM